jgi:hypothetical protein
MECDKETHVCASCGAQTTKQPINFRKYCNVCIIKWLRDDEELIAKLFGDEEEQEDSFDV